MASASVQTLALATAAAALHRLAAESSVETQVSLVALMAVKMVRWEEKVDLPQVRYLDSSPIERLALGGLLRQERLRKRAERTDPRYGLLERLVGALRPA